MKHSVAFVCESRHHQVALFDASFSRPQVEAIARHVAGYETEHAFVPGIGCGKCDGPVTFLLNEVPSE